MSFKDLDLVNKPIYILIYFFSFLVLCLGIFYHQAYSTKFAYLLFLGMVLLFNFSIPLLSKSKSLKQIGLHFDRYTFKYLYFALLIVIFDIIIFYVFCRLFRINYYYFPFSFTIIKLVKYGLIILPGVLIEEFLFRGALFQSFARKYNEIIVSIIFALFFSLIHIYNPGFTILPFINVFLAGLFMNLMVIQSKSLLPPLGFHFLWNFLCPMMFGSKLSGMNLSPAIIKLSEYQTITFFNIFFGGNFGYEGGIVTTILLIINSILVAKYLDFNPFISAYILRDKFEISQ